MTPGAAVSATLVKTSLPPRKTSWAPSVEKISSVAPAVPPPLNSAVPAIVKRLAAPSIESPLGAITVTSSPTS